MTITTRGKTWHIDTTIRGQRIRQSLGTSDKREALRRAKQLEEKLWTAKFVGEQPALPTENHATALGNTDIAEIYDQARKSSRFQDDDEFWKMFSLFNSLDGYFRWQTTEARKSHIDEFGVSIKEREIYFSRNRGPAFHSVEKLSRRSMETLVYTLFDRNPRLELFAKKCDEAWKDELQDAVNSIAPQRRKPMASE